MSKAIGSVFGAGGQASTSMYGSENEILKYLNNYDTTNYDNTLKNLVSYAANASNQLSNMGDYNFSVDGSDAARQRAEQATYQSYLDKLQPQFANQTSDLQTSLANKGISIGSEAYSRAMSDLQDSQNSALNQAAYQATLVFSFHNSYLEELFLLHTFLKQPEHCGDYAYQQYQPPPPQPAALLLSVFETGQVTYHHGRTYDSQAVQIV